MANSLLPQRILPPGTPWLAEDGKSVSKNWWLFLYNLSNSILGQADPVSLELLAELYSDVETADIQGLRSAIDAATMLAEETPFPVPVPDAYVVEEYTPLRPQAQPVQAITPGASPFVYTAPQDGWVTVSGGTVSGLDLTRDGTTFIATGVLAGPIPMSRLDQLKTTYSVVPTMNFFPR